jgi:preprotein translocase subunit SecD
MLRFSRLKAGSIIVITLIGILLALPNLLSPAQRESLPSWLPHRAMTLGLDLRGGSYLLLQVDSQALRKERAEALREDVRRTLREKRIGYTALRATGKGVQVRLRDPADSEKAVTALYALSQPLGGTLIGNAGQRDITVSPDTAAGTVSVDLTDAGITQRVRSAVTQSIEIVRRRIDQLGTTEPTIEGEGADRILVQVPGLQDPARLKHLLGQTAKLTFRLVDVQNSVQAALQGHVPPEDDLLYSNDKAHVPYLVEKSVLVSGEDLTDAQPGFDQRTNEPIVSFRFNARGAKRFGEVTQKNVGRPFAIVLDNQVISAPVIREPILGGSGQISGSFTVEQANDLAILLRAGALPAPLQIIEERTVGPGLGADLIRAGETSAYVGSALVAVFMFVTYGLFGVFAIIAVAINVALIFGILSVLGATLTLPGIAGVVLTVGIAVDSNVLIYERIREEIRAGRGVIGSLEAGFSHALATILDTNITTFIAAAVLFFIGTGTVKGFAVTLGVGILTTLFTAYTLTRLIVAAWVRWRRPRTIPI